MNWRKGLTRLGVVYVAFWALVAAFGAWLYNVGWGYDLVLGRHLVEAAIFMAIILPLVVGFFGGVGRWIWRGFKA